jgi:TolB-like protein
VAIKLLARHLVSDEVAKARFVREARAASALDHPNIANIYEIGEADSELFIAMALYEGETLKQRLMNGRLGVEEAVEVVRQLSLGLEAAHRVGIVHRDIKPANILITRCGTVKILDFGVAKLVSDSQAQTMTQAGQAIGTVLYMSPEQLRGESVDARADLWSLGVLAYEMLAGVSPFQTDSSAATVARILHEEPPSLATVPGVPDWLAELVSRLLRKNPAERSQTASDVLQRLAGGYPRSVTVQRSPGLEARGLLPDPLASPPAGVPHERAALNSWFAELKRRRVFRALVGYAIAAFAVLQIIEPIMHGAHWPEIVLSYVVAGLGVGFPIVVTLAWVFDVKAGRIERTAPAPAATGLRGIRLALSLGVISVLAAAPWLFYYFVLRGHARAPNASGSGGNVATIAVLPFASLGSSEENAYFADGFHDELLRQMGRIDGLRVISRTSVMQYKTGARNLREIAEALGVSSVVEGSVQRAGNRVRVEARLIDARNDLQIWSDRYDRDVSDIFGIQTAVAEEIASALHAQLSPAQRAQIEHKPTHSEEAYDLYLRAREYDNRPIGVLDNLRFAEGLYRQALNIDPSFALARAQLANVLIKVYRGAEAIDELLEEARSQAQQALQSQAGLPEAHAALGMYYQDRGDYQRAVQEFEIVRAANPWLGMSRLAVLRSWQGRFEDAIALKYEEARLNPRSPSTFYGLGYWLFFARRYEEADRAFARALTIAPDFDVASVARAHLHEAWKGDTALAKAVIRDARKSIRVEGASFLFVGLLANNPAEALSFLDSVRSSSDWNFDEDASLPKAYVYARVHEALGNTAMARKEYEAARPTVEAEFLKRLSNSRRGNLTYVAWARERLAYIYSGIGRREDALREANEAVEVFSSSRSANAQYQCFAEITRAAVEGRVGETEAAIEHIRHLLSIPCWLSAQLLRIEPQWAPLRDDPRFRKLAELE